MPKQIISSIKVPIKKPEHDPKKKQPAILIKNLDDKTREGSANHQNTNICKVCSSAIVKGHCNCDK